MDGNLIKNNNNIGSIQISAYVEKIVHTSTVIFQIFH